MRIEDVIAIAGVSRRTFYDHFANKEEAFLAAYELVLEQLLSGVTAAFASGESWTSRVRRGLAAFLNLLASEPVLAQVCVVEALAAGPRALARRTEAMEAFQALLQPPKGDALATSTAPPVAVEAIVGGIYEVIYSRVTSQPDRRAPKPAPVAAAQRAAAVRRRRGRRGRVRAHDAHGGRTRHPRVLSCNTAGETGMFPLALAWNRRRRSAAANPTNCPPAVMASRGNSWSPTSVSGSSLPSPRPAAPRATSR